MHLGIRLLSCTTRSSCRGTQLQLPGAPPHSGVVRVSPRYDVAAAACCCQGAAAPWCRRGSPQHVAIRTCIPQRDHSGRCITGSKSRLSLGRIRSKQVDTATSAPMYTARPPQQLLVRRLISRSHPVVDTMRPYCDAGYQFLYVLFALPRYAYSRSRPVVDSSGGTGVRAILHVGAAVDHSGYYSHCRAVLSQCPWCYR